MDRVRAASRGLVVVEGRLLVTTLQGHTGEFWLTPGGGQRFGESKVDNVAREVLEETGYRVQVGDLACGRDYIGANHFPDWDSGFQQTELFFWCRLLSDEQDLGAMETDQDQTDISWVAVAELVGSPFYPQRLAQWLQEDPRSRPVWLGDVN